MGCIRITMHPFFFLLIRTLLVIDQAPHCLIRDYHPHEQCSSPNPEKAGIIPMSHDELRSDYQQGSYQWGLAGSGSSEPSSLELLLRRARTASVSRYSIWPFTERNSSSAQLTRSCQRLFERRRGICFFSSTGLLIMSQTPLLCTVFSGSDSSL